MKTEDLPEKNELDKSRASYSTEMCSVPIIEDNGDVVDGDFDADLSSDLH